MRLSIILTLFITIFNAAVCAFPAATQLYPRAKQIAGGQVLSRRGPKPDLPIETSFIELDKMWTKWERTPGRLGKNIIAESDEEDVLPVYMGIKTSGEMEQNALMKRFIITEREQSVVVANEAQALVEIYGSSNLAWGYGKGGVYYIALKVVTGPKPHFFAPSQSNPTTANIIRSDFKEKHKSKGIKWEDSPTNWIYYRSASGGGVVYI